MVCCTRMSGSCVHPSISSFFFIVRMCVFLSFLFLLLLLSLPLFLYDLIHLRNILTSLFIAHLLILEHSPVLVNCTRKMVKNLKRIIISLKYVYFFFNLSLHVHSGYFQECCDFSKNVQMINFPLLRNVYVVIPIFPCQYGRNFLARSVLREERYVRTCHSIFWPGFAYWER